MTNREKWLWVAQSFGGGKRLARDILRADTTVWMKMNAWHAMHCVMFYVSAFPEGPPDATE